MHRYPDGGCYHLRRALARKLRVAPEALIFGNGSNEIIELIVRTFLHAGEEAVMADQAFVIYRMLVQAQGGKGIVVPLRNFTHDLEAMADAITPATRIVFLANPNNPTGTIVFREQWEEFLAAVPRDVIIVMDEAYAEFVEDARYPDALADLRGEHLLIVLRTFSKIYGLAGLRVGYGVAHPDIIDLLEPRARAVQRQHARPSGGAGGARRRRARRAHPRRSTARAWPICARRSTASASSACRAGPTSSWCEVGNVARALRRAAAPGRHRAAGVGLRLSRARARHHRHARGERTAGARAGAHARRGGGAGRCCLSAPRSPGSG